MTDLRVKRGDSTTIAIAAKKRDGVTPQPLTGMTLRFTAKAHREDGDGSAVISKWSPSGGITIDDAILGLATVTLAPSDTSGFTGPRTLYWDVQMSDGAGSVKTLADGLLYVLPDITRTG